MNRALLLLTYWFVCMTVATKTVAQTHDLKVPLSLGLQVHFKNSSTNDPPTVGTFFGDAPSYSVGVTYRFIPNRSRIGYVAGIEYEQSTLGNVFPGSEVILGGALRFRSTIPFFGLGLYVGSKPLPTFVTAALGISIKSVSGSYALNGVDVQNLYERGTYFSGLSGVDFEDIGGLPVSIGVGVRFDLGSLTRSDVLFLQKGVEVARGSPTGFLTLQDNTCTLLVSTSYSLKL